MLDKIQQPQYSGIPQPPDRSVFLPEVIKITGKSKTAIYEDRANGRFPSGFLLSARRRAWLLSDVMGWLYDRSKGGA